MMDAIGTGAVEQEDGPGVIVLVALTVLIDFLYADAELLQQCISFGAP